MVDGPVTPAWTAADGKPALKQPLIDKFEFRVLLAAAGAVSVLMLVAAAFISTVALWAIIVLGIVGLVVTAIVILRNHAPAGRSKGYWTMPAIAGLVFASVIASSAAHDAVLTVAQAGKALLYDAPQLLDPSCKLPPARAMAGIFGRMAGDDQITCAAGPSKVQAFRSKSAEPLTNLPYTAGPEDWAAFLAIFATTLLLFHSVSLARAAWVEKELKPDQIVIMDYPTWVAFLIYATILTPAAYFAVGALLYLKADSSPADITSYISTLAAAEQSNPVGTPDVDFVGLRQKAEVYISRQGNVDNEGLRSALRGASAFLTTFYNFQSDFRSQARYEVVAASKRLSGSRFADYKTILLAEFVADSKAVHQQGDECFKTLTTLDAQLDAINNPPSQPGSRSGAPAAPAASPAAPPPLPGPIAPVAAPAAGPAVQGAGGRGAAGPSRVRPLAIGVAGACPADVKFGEPMKYVSFDPEGATALAQAYQWLAISPDTTVLITGLVGFGLFGAAIRMMGHVAGSRQASTGDWDPEDGMKEYRVVADRGDGRLGVSGAPARVLVQGVGAAFTVFLGGQAGAMVITTESKPNVYSLLLICFIGAVFAEEIWKWAQSLLQARLAGSPHDTAGAPTPALSGAAHPALPAPGAAPHPGPASGAAAPAIASPAGGGAVPAPGADHQPAAGPGPGASADHAAPASAPPAAAGAPTPAAAGSAAPAAPAATSNPVPASSPAAPPVPGPAGQAAAPLTAAGAPGPAAAGAPSDVLEPASLPEPPHPTAGP
jgi:hypothetical protein